MIFYNHLKSICEEKGLKITPTVLNCGGTKGMIGGWQKGGCPNSDIIVKLAEYLNVSTDYLITGKDFSLTKEQQSLLDDFEKLSSDNQSFASKFIKTVLEMQLEKDKSSTITPNVVSTQTINIRHSIYKVSAGFGYDLDAGDQWDTIEVPYTSESEKADFALTISGKSMEPIFYDRDIVLVKKQPAVDLGQVGIFIIESSGYIKKYGGDRLISLNEEFDDIMFSDYDPDDIRCVGLVIGRV